MSKILDKQIIVQVKDQVLELVEVPEWGGAIYVRSITARERGLIEAGAAKYKETKGKDDSFARTFSLKMVAQSICDETGARLFDDSEIELLAGKNAAVVARISDVAQRLSGFSKEDLEELEKNSGKAEAGDSPSA
jgi:hypothetical protein